MLNLKVKNGFSHWGSRFQYQRYKPETKNQPIHETIEKLDKDAVKLIEKKDGPGFYSYLKGNFCAVLHSLTPNFRNEKHNLRSESNFVVSCNSGRRRKSGKIEYKSWITFLRSVWTRHQPKRLISLLCGLYVSKVLVCPAFEFKIILLFVKAHSWQLY